MSKLRVLVVVVLVGIAVLGVGYFGFTQVAGTGEASVNVVDVAPTLAANNIDAVTYRIEPAGSEARFIITEDLRGEPKTVIGSTKEIGGELSVNLENPAQSQVGAILINARTLTTDDSNRNRALRTFILRSAEDAYEFIRFEPQSLSGLPETPVTPGEEISFQITGNLTIVDTTREVTFDAVVTPGTDGILSGSASTTIQHADYNLTIPSVPFVANISPDVTLEFDFTAVPVTE